MDFDSDNELESSTAQKIKNQSNDEVSNSSEDLNLWADIPVDEIMPDNAAPCLQFLLK